MRTRVVGAVLFVGLLGGVLALGSRGSPRAQPPQPSPAVAVQQALAPAAPAEVPGPPEMGNWAAYLPPQCYAATQDTAGGRVHNSCFACHQTPRTPNFTDDAQVQEVLSVPRYAQQNRWEHVLRPPKPVELPEPELLSWVRFSNYLDEHGGLRLAAALEHPSPAWDSNGDGRWEGYTPDCWFHPDDEGFDRSPDGSLSGWRAFAYAPYPGMFWPTNGSAGDVFLRLPQAFRQDTQGHESVEVYRLNLAILEAFIRRTDVPLPPTDERELGVDLDGDGVLGTAKQVAFVWPPRPERPFGYVGKAAQLDRAQEGWPAAGLYPRGTEFLHSLRYLDVDSGSGSGGGQVRMAARMKELRYMRKARWQTYSDLQLAAEAEVLEKTKRPDKLKTVLGDVEHGLGTGSGWRMQAFIEDASGALRPQTVEETAACIGCHGGVGATTDSTFSFARKFGSGFRSGWYHWADRGLKGIPEPRRADGQGEYAHWLEQVGGGDDYRSNDEVQARFFRKDGTLQPSAVKALSRDISVLLVPSPQRALLLDRAYLALVREQNFEQGREVLVGAAPQVKPRLEQDGTTGITPPVAPGWLPPAKTATR